MKIEKTTTMILIVILMMGLINSLMSCTTSKVGKMVYVPKNTYDTTNVSSQNPLTTFTY